MGEDIMAFTPKNATKVTGFTPKSGVRVDQVKQRFEPFQENKVLEGITSLTELLAPALTSTVNLTRARGLGAMSKQEQRLQEQQQIAQRQILEQARQTQDAAEKQRLLQQSRQIDREMGRGSETLQAAESELMDLGNMLESDLSRSNFGFATRRGVGTAAEVGSYLLPSTQGARALTAAAGTGSNLSSRAARVGVQSLLGLGQGTFQGISQAAMTADSGQEAVEDIMSDALLSSATAGVTQSGFEALGMFKNSLGNWMKRGASQQLLGQTPSEVVLDEQGFNKTAERLMEKFDDGTYKPGGYQSLREQSEDLITESRKKAFELADKSDEVIDRDDIVKQIDELIKIRQSADDDAAVRALNNYKDTFINNNPKQLTMSEALRKRINLERTMSDASFRKSASETASNKLAGQKTVSNYIRNWIRDVDPDLGDTLLDESAYISVKKAAEKQLQRMGTAPINQGSAGSQNILNRLGQLLTAVPRNPRASSTFLSATAPPNAQQLARFESLRRLLPAAIAGGNDLTE